MAFIRWLHLSDLHFDAAVVRDPYHNDRILDPLVRAVEEEVKCRRCPDLIFVTGDIGNYGKKNDYAPAESYLQRLLVAAGLKSDALWMVPGNHDVDRDRLGAGLARTLTSPAQSNSFFDADKDDRKAVLPAFRHYRDFANKFASGRRFVRDEVVFKPGVVDIAGVKVGVLSLNSAWFSRDDNDDKKLWLGRRRIDEARTLFRDTNDRPAIVIALVHHPSSWLNETDREWEFLEEAADVILSGHLHMDQAGVMERDWGRCLMVSAGSTYLRSDWPHRVFFAQFDTEKRTFELRPFHYVDQPGATGWCLDHDVFSKDRDGIGRFSLRPALPPPPGPAPPEDFPFSTWEAVKTAGWLEDAAEWFERHYEGNPVDTMKKLIAHVFDILKGAASQPLWYEPVMQLGQRLAARFPRQRLNRYPHHGDVLEVLELGIHQQPPHLFMQRQVRREELVDVPDYSKLLLACRYYAAGRHDDALRLATELPGCLVCACIRAQIFRRRESDELYRAASVLEDGRKQLSARSRGQCCLFALENGQTGRTLCDELALRAALSRLLGVVYRTQARVLQRPDLLQQAEKAFEEAVKAAETRSNAPVGHSDDARAMRAVAEVLFSVGYFHYENDRMDKAGPLLERSMDCVKKAREDWDAPYVRFGVVCFLKKDYDRAIQVFTDGHEVCDRIPVSSNRDAPLGKACCSLGLRMIEATGRLGCSAGWEPLDELRQALEARPPLEVGPLKCHRKDAEVLGKAFASACPGTTKPPVAVDFERMLDEAILGCGSPKPCIGAG